MKNYKNRKKKTYDYFLIKNSEENQFIMQNNNSVSQFGRALPFDMGPQPQPQPQPQQSQFQQQQQQPQTQQQQQQQPQQPQEPPKPKLFSRQNMLKEEEEKVIDQLKQSEFELLQRRTYSDYSPPPPPPNADPYSHYGQQISFSMNKFRSSNNLDSERPFFLLYFILFWNKWKYKHKPKYVKPQTNSVISKQK
jgi:hypothetical protein